MAADANIQAFEELLAAYQDKVFRLCYSMLGDRAQAEDAAQENFLRIWKSMERYRGEAALGTWIFFDHAQCLPDRDFKTRRAPVGASRRGRALHAAGAGSRARSNAAGREPV
jgi:hypothetical protein